MKSLKHKGSGILVITLMSAIFTGMISLSLAKVSNISKNSFGSTRLAIQAQSLADSKMEFLSLVDYDEIVSQNRQAIGETDYFDSVVVGAETNLGDGITSKDVTVNVFHSDDAVPRYRLTKIFYSNGNNEYVFNDDENDTRIGILNSNGRIVTRLDDAEQKLLTSMTPSYTGNLNNLVETGFFNGNNLGNAPSTEWYYIENIRHSNMNNYYINQRLTNFNNGKLYNRQCRNGSWSGWTEVGGAGGAFSGWTDSFPASGTAPGDGIITARSNWNADISIKTSGVERVYTSRRDKYGQGYTTVTCPVKKGESYSVSGAGYIRFMQLGS